MTPEGAACRSRRAAGAAAARGARSSLRSRRAGRRRLGHTNRVRAPRPGGGHPSASSALRNPLTGPRSSAAQARTNLSGAACRRKPDRGGLPPDSGGQNRDRTQCPIGGADGVTAQPEPRRRSPVADGTAIRVLLLLPRTGFRPHGTGQFNSPHGAVLK